MLTEQPPAEVLIEWAGKSKIVKNGMDRPWYHADPPIFASDVFQPPCRCHTPVKLVRYPCEDGAGYIYIGQCGYCQTVIWSFLECAGK